MYILVLMFFVARLAAQARLNDLVGQENYVIDSLCVDNIRTYTMIGEQESTYKWIVMNE